MSDTQQRIDQLGVSRKKNHLHGAVLQQSRGEVMVTR